MQKKDQSSLIEVLLWPVKGILLLFQAALFAAFIIGGWFILQMFGVMPVQVPVSGASMLPTLPEEGMVDFQRYVPDSRIQKIFPQNLKYGDIVVFESEETAEELKKQHKDGTGFVKRVVGVPGDIVSIRDGFVTVNGKAMAEPYILKPRSTFGGDKIGDCQQVKVPEGKVFVLGDNRKVSMDSRQIGLVAFDDIEYFIPFSKQQEQFGDKWRDSSHDLDSEHESLFDVYAYLSLLNEERGKNGLDPLKYDVKLELSAKLRAENMLKYNDFSFNAPKSGYTMVESMKDAGYSNIVYGEFPMTGYYDAQELFDAFIEQAEATEFLLNTEYDDIGVSTFIGDLNGCPVQVVVQHLAGYVPPEYKPDEIAAWRDGLRRLQEVKSGWEKLRDYEEFYNKNKTDVDRMNELINTRIVRFEQILKRMAANEWLNEEEKRWMKEDASLAEEQNNLAEKLNKEVN